jgi:hypothetical protein
VLARHAMKPKPKTDVGLCRAVLTAMVYGNSISGNPEPTRFENKAQIDAFTDKIHSISMDAFKMAQLYCTDVEMRRPIKQH